VWEVVEDTDLGEGGTESTASEQAESTISRGAKPLTTTLNEVSEVKIGVKLERKMLRPHVVNEGSEPWGFLEYEQMLVHDANYLHLHSGKLDLPIVVIQACS
jgi:hypothetical protein